AAGAMVILEPRQGYGSAYLAGLAAAQGDYVVMVDADLTYDLREIPRFVRELDAGAQLVVGNRMQGIRPGAMPWLNRYVGNPLLSLFGRSFFVHTLIAGSLLIVVGVQVIGLGLCARAYGVYFMGERDSFFEGMRRRVRLEHGLLLAVACIAGALALAGVIISR